MGEGESPARCREGLIRAGHCRAAARAPRLAAPPPSRSREPVLVGVVLDPATARKRARDEAYRATPDAVMMRAISGG